MKKHLKAIKKYIKEGYGPKCPDFYYACHVCQIWAAVDVIEDAYEMSEIIADKKWKKNQANIKK